MPLSGIIPTATGAPGAQGYLIVDQAGAVTPQGPLNANHTTPLTSPLSDEQVKLIVSEAKGCLWHAILCKTPFLLKLR